MEKTGNSMNSQQSGLRFFAPEKGGKGRRYRGQGTCSFLELSLLTVVFSLFGATYPLLPTDLQ